MPLKRLLRGVAAINRLPEVVRCRTLFPEWKKLAACYLGFHIELPFSITLPCGSFNFRTVTDVRTFWLIWCARTYPVRQSDKVIIDAGANIGAFTLYALVHAPNCRVIAIEPAPDTFERLAAMVVANNMQTRCTLVNAALGKSSGMTHIDLRPESQFRQTGKGHAEVNLLTFPDINRERVDLLKMDIEGSELDAVSAPGALASVRRLAMEFHPEVPLQDMMSSLKLSGFQVERVRHDGLGYGMLWANATHKRGSLAPT